MPHMMPMLWTMIFLSSLLFLFVLSALIYFFYLPCPSFKKLNLKFYSWKWMW